MFISPLLRPACSLAVGFVLSLLGAILLFFGDVVMFASAYFVEPVITYDSLRSL